MLTHDELIRRQVFGGNLDAVAGAVDRFSTEKHDTGFRWGRTGEQVDPVALGYRRGVRLAGFTDLPVVDWDFPDAVHKLADSVTVRHLGDVAELTHEYLKTQPDKRFLFQLTPGGVHAFELSAKTTPVQFHGDPATAALRPDPHHADLTRRPTTVEGQPLADGAFWVRTGPKPVRDRAPEREFIAAPIGVMGSGLADPVQMDLLARYHNQTVAEELARNPMGRQAMVEARLAIANQLATVSPALRRLHGLGG